MTFVKRNNIEVKSNKIKYKTKSNVESLWYYTYKVRFCEHKNTFTKWEITKATNSAIMYFQQITSLSLTNYREKYAPFTEHQSIKKSERDSECLFCAIVDVLNRKISLEQQSKMCLFVCITTQEDIRGLYIQQLLW